MICIVARGLFFDLWCALYSDHVIREYTITGGPNGGLL